MKSTKKPTPAQKKWCGYGDCGWCYAPAGVENNSQVGACNKPQECPQMANREQAKP